MKQIYYKDIFFLTNRRIFEIIVLTLILFWCIYIFFHENLVPLEFIITGIITIILFFIILKWTSTNILKVSTRDFVYKIFIIGVFLRLFATLILYHYFLLKTGSPFEYNAVDSKFYHATGLELSNQILNNNYNFKYLLNDINFSDRGYNILLGFIYALTGKSILFTRIIFSIVSAFSVVLLYKCGKNIFDEKTGRLAAIIMLLIPNFSLYLGTHLKETILVFLVLLFLDQSIRFIKYKNKKIKSISIVFLCVATLFMFRTVLGVVAIATFIGYVFTIRPIIRNVNTILIALVFMVLFYILLSYTEIGLEINEYLQKSSTAVSDNLKFRAERDGGNKFALFAGAPLFISIILIAPFPSMVYVKGQDFLWMFMAANFIKNILAYFTIKGLYISFKVNFKKSSILFFFLGGYLLILANSGFAISERFHLPILPITIIMISLGLTKQINGKYSFFFLLYNIIICIVILIWNYIKLAGRI